MGFESPVKQEGEQEAVALSAQYWRRWNQLVSTTNWEKGSIICQWRKALQAGGLTPHHFSDEAWSRQIGNVTPQHTGRLRKVSVRFGALWQDYPGLYWSHFFASLDWEDPELWLEGAIQNHWSVSQMQTARSKARETLTSPTTQADDIFLTELDENFVLGVDPPNRSTGPSLDNIHLTDSSHAVGIVTGSSVERKSKSTAEHSTSVPFRDLVAGEENWPKDLQKAFQYLERILLQYSASAWRDVKLKSVLLKLNQLKAQLKHRG